MKNALLVPGIFSGILVYLMLFVQMNNAEQAGFDTMETLTLGIMAVGLVLAQVVTLARVGQLAGIRQSWLQRVLTAAIATLLSSSVLALLLWFHYRVLDPDYLAERHAFFLQRLRGMELPETVLREQQQVLESSREYLLAPFQQAMLQAGTMLAIGILLSVIVASFLRGTHAGQQHP